MRVKMATLRHLCKSNGIMRLTDAISAETFRALATIAGGEEIPHDWN
jgi:hypothetical protein